MDGWVYRYTHARALVLDTRNVIECRAELAAVTAGGTGLQPSLLMTGRLSRIRGTILLLEY